MAHADKGVVVVLTLILIGLLGGLITGVSPCVLPILPVIFFAGGAGVPSPESGTSLPLRQRNWRPTTVIAGLVLSFSVFTLLGSVLLAALGLPQDLFRWAGLAVLTLIGIGLIFPSVNEWIVKPFSRFPKIRRRADGNGFVLGLGLGALYVPCAGPVLAAIAIAGTTGRIDGRIVALTLAFAVGAAVPLFVFALAGSSISKRLTAYRSRARGFRLAGGVVMIALALALTFNLTDGLQRAVPNYTQSLQAQVVQINPTAVAPATTAAAGGPAPTAAGPGTTAAGATPAAAGPATTAASSGATAVARVPSSAAAASQAAPFIRNPDATLASCKADSLALGDCGAVPSFGGISRWFNTQDSAPLTTAGLKGKVVLVTFWTYSCINCQRALPHVESWDAAYRRLGLQVVGIHTPEFSFEKVPANVQQGIADQHLQFPVGMDNSATTWTNFHNSYWPAQYLIDSTGTVRHIKYGEGDYANSETLIRQLLTAAHPGLRLPAAVESGSTS